MTGRGGPDRRSAPRPGRPGPRSRPIRPPAPPGRWCWTRGSRPRSADRPGASPGRARSGRGRADRPARHRPRPGTGAARSRSRRRRAHRGPPGRGPSRSGPSASSGTYSPAAARSRFIQRDVQRFGGRVGAGHRRHPPAAAVPVAWTSAVSGSKTGFLRRVATGHWSPEKSIARSSDGAEWVRAPTLIRSTPAAAMAPTVARLIPPEASSWIDGATASRRRTASAIPAAPRLSTRMMSGPDRRATSSCSSVSTSTSTTVPAGTFARADATAAAIGSSPPTAAALQPGQVVVLDQHGVVQAEAVIPPAAAAHRVFLQGPPAGGRLAGVVDRRAGAGGRGHEPRGQGRDPAEPLEEVQQRAFQGQQRSHGPGQPGHDRTGLESVAVRLVGPPMLEQLELGDQPLGDGQARQHARRARHQAGGARASMGIVDAEVMSPTWPRSSAMRQGQERLDVAPARSRRSRSGVEADPSCSNPGSRRGASGFLHTRTGPSPLPGRQREASAARPRPCGGPCSARPGSSARAAFGGDSRMGNCTSTGSVISRPGRRRPRWRSPSSPAGRARSRRSPRTRRPGPSGGGCRRKCTRPG